MSVQVPANQVEDAQNTPNTQMVLHSCSVDTTVHVHVVPVPSVAHSHTHFTTQDTTTAAAQSSAARGQEQDSHNSSGQWSLSQAH